MDIYLDIDGVILANDLNAANYAHEFLKHLTGKYQDNIFWLTTHCQGNSQTAVDRLRSVLKPETIELLHQVKPTKWNVAKTEAIDFSKPFIWFDDDLYPEERADLIKHNAISSWVKVDLSRNENQLKDLTAQLLRI